MSILTFERVRRFLHILLGHSAGLAAAQSRAGGGGDGVNMGVNNVSRHMLKYLNRRKRMLLQPE